MVTATTEKTPQKHGTFLGLRVKLVVGFTLIFSVVFGVAYFWFFTFATDMAIDRIKSDLSGTLLGAADKIDKAGFEELVTDAEPRADGYTDDPNYWNHVEWLATVNEIEPRAFVYSFINGERPDELIFIGSSSAPTDVELPPEEREGVTFRAYCLGYTLTPDEIEALGVADDPKFIASDDCGDGSTNLGVIETGSTVFEDYYTDQWGEWISAYTPIVNDDQQIIGGLGIDFEASYVKEVQNNILDSVVYSFIITYTALFLLVFIVSRTLTRPMRQLTKAAEKIADGNYDLAEAKAQIGGRFRDEITTLAEVFVDMADKVYKREAKLKQQVAELKIEIDEVKARKQVSEIVDSDFFEELKDKANVIRKRKAEREQPGSEE
jgi:HAMP domain-containing protein